MQVPIEAAEILNREFLLMRAKLLELAASFDRLDRATGDVESDPRMGQIRQALEILEEDELHRAERVQQVFSQPYAAGWNAGLREGGERPTGV